MKLLINITLKEGVLDPQGLAIKNSLSTLGFENINTVKQGKIIEIDIFESDIKNAEAQASLMCEKLLANIVIEDYSIKVIGKSA
jgi:phosphoribosylformylglycinamidine synthase|tara:strand:- start:200 stop:451 length:252 start_codon:yes stop_codon:yes gene_type:complete